MPIDKPYAYHQPSAEGQTRIDRLREHFSEGARLIEEVCGDPRRKAIALTQNEQTAMWAIKAVVFSDPDAKMQTPAPPPGYVSHGDSHIDRD